LQKTVEINSKGLMLRGMLHIPDASNGKIPLVCIFHGFTGNKMESHFIFVKLSRLLEKKGIASLRFDFAGSGESDGEFKDMTISKELDDAKAILDYAISLDFVDNQRIGAVGLSLGGAVASMLAGDRAKDVKALCLWAPAGNMKEIILANIKNKDDDLKATRELGIVDVGGNLVGINFYDDVIDLDIYGKAAAYKGKVLLLHGSNDVTVPKVASEKYLSIYGEKAKLHIIENADHTFNKKEWEEEVINETLSYFAKEL